MWLMSVLYFLLPAYVLGSLREQICPNVCLCSIQPCQVLEKDAKTVNCVNSSLLLIPENISTDTEVLEMKSNILGHSHRLSLLNLLFLRRLRLVDFSFNHIRNFRHYGIILDSVLHLNLSNNCLIVLETGVFHGFPNLQTLDLSSNQISTIAPLSLELPKLKILNMAHNRLSSLFVHYFAILRSVESLLLSDNHITRLSEPVLHHLRPVKRIDLTNNRITKLDYPAFQHIEEVQQLLLSGNNLVLVPTKALKKVPSINILDLSRNLFHDLPSFSFDSINVSEIVLNQNKNLFVIAKNAFYNMNSLKTIEITDNKQLSYIEPEAFENLLSLKKLDISKNNLQTVHQDMFHRIPFISTLNLQGNPLRCACDIKWVQEIVQNFTSDVIYDNITCIDENSKTRFLATLQPLPSSCGPYILPLFPLHSDQLPASTVSFVCAATGIPRPEVMWFKENSENFTYGEHQRLNIHNGILNIRYLHVEDSGVFVCIALNSQGNTSRSLELVVEKVNIKITPLTIASTFITLSWNMTNNFNSDYLLQYSLLGDEKVFSKPIAMGVKIHYFTISDLEPGETYNIWLCLQNGGFIIRLSSVLVTTKEEGFLFMLGIHTNHLGIILVSVCGSVVTASCICMCTIRFCRWQCRQHNEMVLSETSSQRGFAKSDSSQSDLAFMTFVNVADETGLMENDDESYE
ncbi:uncharacterized protein LOC143255361 [Tachypleus tridentatus]|uniref:uncharacterized protein LOC143255361 n=1 Tax=Tachypleus tridentatus TaxID=6853 RepID=UPI003FD1DB2D